MSNIDVYDFEKVGRLIADSVDLVSEGIQKLGEVISEIAERIGEIIDEFAETMRKAKPRPKYKLVKSLIKPYKEPYLKIRYRARANL